MKLNFDYYHNLEDTELYLCNPDGRELFPLVGFNRIMKLRFNDLSELTFSCYSTTTASDGTIVKLDSYDWIETRRLVFATNIGWFVITGVNENDNGVVKYKDVTCHSLQAELKNHGFYCEEKVYYFFNNFDATDENYDPDDEKSIPSVAGQLYQQLGIQQDLQQGLADPATPYENWTITYINNTLIDKGRNFKKATTYGYDWIVKDVEKAFKVVILFDFFYKTIHVMLPSEVTTKARVIYTFSNFMKNIEVDEDASNIVTVMNCKGDDCDITTVNPTGTNYICDFSFYMDDAGKWMSPGLKEKLTQWNTAVEAATSDYQSKVLQLRTKYGKHTSLTSTLQEISKIYTDLAAAVANKSVADSEGASLSGKVWTETVNIGETSMDPTSAYFAEPLSNETITAYREMPGFINADRTWACSGTSMSGTMDECCRNRYYYFIDSSDNSSYCKLAGKSTIDTATNTAVYTCKGFKRYIDLNIANQWTDRYDEKRAAIQAQIKTLATEIANLETSLKNISEPINILNYFSGHDNAQLLKELMCYWIEGDYKDENIAVLESTTPEEAIDLGNELLEAGKLELIKVCQPKYQFSLTSVDCTKLYEFRDQMKALELGKIITVEKEDGLWYYPTLLEIEYNLDHTDSFNLKFANALRLDDWGYTYGDLITDASSTSRKVSANWQSIMQYSKDKSQITPLIQKPLSATLRAAFANMTNQEFVINDDGILGRRFISPDVKNKFSDEQMRITNNVILFTDDNWENTKTAFGKVSYTDPDTTVAHQTYGIIGEAIVGSLIMGEKLYIGNAATKGESSIILDENGITIKQGDTTVFSANTEGKVIVGGWNSPNDVTKIDGSRIATGSINADSLNVGTVEMAGFTVENGCFYSNNRSTIDSDETGVYIGTDGISVRSENGVMLLKTSDQTFSFEGTVYANAGSFTGTVNATSGTFTGTVNATSGTFTGTVNATSGRFGSATNPFIIGTSRGDPNSASIFLNFEDEDQAQFAGMGGLGSDSVKDNSVYIGGDGFSYFNKKSTLYTTAIRPGLVVCMGNSGPGHRATVVDSTGLTFSWGGSTPLNNLTSGHIKNDSYRKAWFVTGENNVTLYGTWVVDAQWQMSTSPTTTSDINVKNTIGDLSDKYELMFDALHPVTYKYNYGTSGRLHSGFVAQEVLDAMNSSGVDTQDFAAYVESRDNDGNVVCGLRYEEFVALNTWQIQKLKRRITALETEVALLRASI